MNLEPIANKMAEGLLAHRQRGLAEAFGLPFDPSLRYRLRAHYDTQTIQNDDTITEFFNTATSTAAANAYGNAGCTLSQRGQINPRTLFLIVGFSVQYVGCVGGDAAKVADVGIASDFGQLDSLWIGNRPVIDHPIPFVAMPCNGGVTYTADGIDSAAFACDIAVNGSPGGDPIGYRLPTFARILAQGEQDVKANLVQRSGGNLAAALAAKFSMWGVEVEPANG